MELSKLAEELQVKLKAKVELREKVATKLLSNRENGASREGASEQTATEVTVKPSQLWAKRASVLKARERDVKLVREIAERLKLSENK